MAFLIGGAFGFIIMSILLDVMPWRILWNIFYFLFYWTLQIIMLVIVFAITAVVWPPIFIFRVLINKFKKPKKENESERTVEEQ